ncbi:hypothetical protein EJ08DRAFT_649868 [Tothia fuscella]|uniref:Uncharacterized protein n=1 Tax=Tothia fuscella TaxID=1048955 RepID=A0A9P4NQZ5_9PEZI|nr:hypothetical protein EJ08DRAFT_649868 [Tothia fuscella]
MKLISVVATSIALLATTITALPEASSDLSSPLDRRATKPKIPKNKGGEECPTETGVASTCTETAAAQTSSSAGFRLGGASWAMVLVGSGAVAAVELL